MFWTVLGIGFAAWLLLVILFTPRIDYHVSARLDPESPAFTHVLQSTCHSTMHGGNRVEILTNGPAFYPAMRDAIAGAQASITLEAYIISPGRVAAPFIDALVDRARTGVSVRIVLDAIGSAGCPYVPRLREAGCLVHFYQPVRWHLLHRLNNRTHREILIVDGCVAFTGGAGIADRWGVQADGSPPWRDTMARLEGPIVAALQGLFAENWLECSGEILTDSRHWPTPQPAGTTEALLIKSSPSDRATASRVAFQMLIEGAVRSIDISTPYFLPDKALRGALRRAAARGVTVRVAVPGTVTDQRLVRLAGRRLYGELLKDGVRLFEYRPSMTHVKALIVDERWALIGTTNIDNRSFEHNDEVNVALHDEAVAGRLRADFDGDLALCDEVTLPAWQARSWAEKMVGPICWILERQQ
ncbi:MAG: phospholipase D-like domain-containing protein [Vicinamibacterales bacterium]